MTPQTSTIALDLLAGVGALLVGIGVLLGMLALARTLNRLNVTLDGVDRQLDRLGEPVAQTLGHIGGIADTADRTVARLSGVADALEGVAGTVSQTAGLAKDAAAPAIVNIGATVAGITGGLRRLVTGKNSTDPTAGQE